MKDSEQKLNNNDTVKNIAEPNETKQTMNRTIPWPPKNLPGLEEQNKCFGLDLLEPPDDRLMLGIIVIASLSVTFFPGAEDSCPAVCAVFENAQGHVQQVTM